MERREELEETGNNARVSEKDVIRWKNGGKAREKEMQSIYKCRGKRLGCWDGKEEQGKGRGKEGFCVEEMRG